MRSWIWVVGLALGCGTEAPSQTTTLPTSSTNQPQVAKVLSTVVERSDRVNKLIREPGTVHQVTDRYRRQLETQGLTVRSIPYSGAPLQDGVRVTGRELVAQSTTQLATVTLLQRTTEPGGVTVRYHWCRRAKPVASLPAQHTGGGGSSDAWWSLLRRCHPPQRSKTAVSRRSDTATPRRSDTATPRRSDTATPRRREVIWCPSPDPRCQYARLTSKHGDDQDATAAPRRFTLKLRYVRVSGDMGQNVVGSQIRVSCDAAAKLRGRTITAKLTINRAGAATVLDVSGGDADVHGCVAQALNGDVFKSPADSLTFVTARWRVVAK